MTTIKINNQEANKYFMILLFMKSSIGNLKKIKMYTSNELLF